MITFLEFLFFSILVLFPFGQFTRLPLTLPTGEVNIYLLDILIGLFSSLGLRIIAKDFKNCSNLLLAILPFCFVSLVSLLLSPLELNLAQMTVSFLYWLRWAGYAIAPLVIVVLSKKYRKFTRNNLLNYLLVIGISVVVFGLTQYILWPDLTALNYLNWDPHYYRLTGTFFDPNYSGIIIAFTVILLILKNYAKLNHPTKNKLFFFLVFISVAALVLTFSRSSFLAFFVMVFMIFVIKKSYLLFVLPLIVLLILVAVLPLQTKGEGVNILRVSTIESRLVNWQQTIQIGTQNVISGVGFNTYRYAQQDFGFSKNQEINPNSSAGADSSLLFVFATTGVVGLVTYIYFFYKNIASVYRCKKSELCIYPICLSGVFIHSFFVNSLFYPWVLLWLGILLAAEITQQN